MPQRAPRLEGREPRTERVTPRAADAPPLPPALPPPRAGERPLAPRAPPLKRLRREGSPPPAPRIDAPVVSGYDTPVDVPGLAIDEMNEFLLEYFRTESESVRPEDRHESWFYDFLWRHGRIPLHEEMERAGALPLPGRDSEIDRARAWIIRERRYVEI